MSQVVIGVDIAKDKFDVARLSEGRYRHKQFANHPAGFATLLAWLQGFGDAAPWVGMEATGTFSIPLAEFLVEQSAKLEQLEYTSKALPSPVAVRRWTVFEN